MYRFAMICVMITICNCSPIWNNARYPADKYMGSCPAPHWVYIVDSISAITALTFAVMIQSSLINVSNSDAYSTNPMAYYVPLYLISSAFFVSAFDGAGQMAQCYRNGEQ